MNFTENKQLLLGDNENEIIHFLENSIQQRRNIRNIITFAMSHDKHLPINYILDHQNRRDQQGSYDFSFILTCVFRYANVHFYNLFNEQNLIKKDVHLIKIIIQNKHNDFIFDNLTDWFNGKQIFAASLKTAIIYQNIEIFNYLMNNENLTPFLTRKTMNYCFQQISKMNIEMFETLSQKYLELFKI
jgi:hypothetical protein